MRERPEPKVIEHFPNANALKIRKMLTFGTGLTTENQDRSLRSLTHVYRISLIVFILLALSFPLRLRFDMMEMKVNTEE